MNNTNANKPVVVTLSQREKVEGTEEMSWPVKLEQILAGSNEDCKRAVIVMIDAAYRKMLRDTRNQPSAEPAMHERTVYRDH